MNIGEASRQYQTALEAERRARSMFAGVTSAQSEIEAAAEETAAARWQIIDAMVETLWS